MPESNIVADTHTRLRKHWRIKAAALALAVALAGPVVLFLLLNALYPFPKERIQDTLDSASPMIFAADGSLIAWQVDKEENWRLPVKLDEVSPWLISATVAVEDKRFYNHIGVDPIATTRAAGQLLRHLKTVSGSSTLTMQSIRLMWQRPRRLSSKLVEAFRAIQLEREIGKDGILTLYFNLAPYGGNIVGAEAAARKYFGKSAAGLTLGEASLLAGIPQSPSRLDPRRFPERALERRRQVLYRMVELDMITQAQAAQANSEKLEFEKVGPRLDVLHFAAWIQSIRPSGQSKVRTTLDPDYQSKVEMLAKRHNQENAAKGLSGPAVVVLSVRDSSILAYLGNADGALDAGWQIDGIRVRRQPGSLLKPFLFASLADRGMITPSSRVYDLPSFWEGYAPKNMDRDWSGEMSAEDALRQSRNIPAVKQLSQLGIESFGQVMRKLDLDPGKAGRTGLTLALGSREQQLLSLANAYAAMARLGNWLPIRAFQDETIAYEPRKIWAPEAVWLTISALSPPANKTKPTQAWKTGTSWNQRDAWAVVFTPEAVIGVWTGRGKGGGSSWAVGAEDALPLALDIADTLGVGKTATWPVPAGIEFTSVCATSGTLPSWNCPEIITSPIDRNRLDNRQCRQHLGTTLENSPSTTKNSTLVPAAGKTSKEPGKRLTISSPQRGACYVTSEGEFVYFIADYSDSAEQLFWFVDGKLFATSHAGEKVAWKMSRGNHIVVVTAANDNERVAFSVISPEEIPKTSL